MRTPRGKVGELYALYVHPQAWSTGVGRSRHDEALKALVAAGHREATLWVLDPNRRGRDFSYRQGWLPDGGKKTEERPGRVLMEVRYRRSLHAESAAELRSLGGLASDIEELRNVCW